jgi:glucose uptake protein GlcU
MFWQLLTAISVITFSISVLLRRLLLHNDKSDPFAYIAKPKSVLKMKPFTSGKVITRMLLLGVIFSVSALTSLLVYRDGNVSLVATLQQTGIIVTTIFGIIFLNERKNLLRKGLSAIVCFVAVLLIV